MLKLNIVKEVHSEPFVVFASLPDMGRVGGLTSTFLASQFDAELVAEHYLSRKTLGECKGRSSC